MGGNDRGGSTRVIDLAGKKLLGVVKNPAPAAQAVVALFFVASDKQMIAVYRQGVVVWDFERKQPLRNTEAVLGRDLVSAALTPDRMGLWIADGDGDLSLHKVTGLRSVLRPTNVGSEVTCLAVSPDGRTVVVGLDNGIYALDATNGKKTSAVQGPRFSVQEVRFFNEGRSLIAVNQNVMRAEHWDALSFKPLPLIANMPARWISTTAVSPDATRLAWGTADGVVQIADLPSNKSMREWRLGAGPVEHLLFSPDGHTLAVVCMGQAVRLLDVKTGKRLNRARGTMAG